MIQRRFEYRSVILKSGGFLGGNVDQEEFERELNRMGQDGWELVSVFDTNQGHGTTRFIVAVFKREV
ncbi:MAG: DUF4177 domain-containing protein [Planctomycetes bacterium]|nr:DUF4177 domain-containing protein [Planctomycetota bacterium]